MRIKIIRKLIESEWANSSRRKIKTRYMKTMRREAAHGASGGKAATVRETEEATSGELGGRIRYLRGAQKQGANLRARRGINV